MREDGEINIDLGEASVVPVKRHPPAARGEGIPVEPEIEPSDTETKPVEEPESEPESVEELESDSEPVEEPESEPEPVEPEYVARVVEPVPEYAARVRTVVFHFFYL